LNNRLFNNMVYQKQLTLQNCSKW